MSQLIVDFNDLKTREEYESLTYIELKKIASELQISGRSFLRRKRDLIDAIMYQRPQLIRQPTLKCSALCISTSTLTRCTKYSNNQYCSNHQQRYRLEKPDDCPVCMDSISGETETPLECGHWIHKSCLVPTNLHICPVCRQNMKSYEVEYVFGSNHQQRNTYGQNYYIPFLPEPQVRSSLYNNNIFHNQLQYSSSLSDQFDNEYEMDGIDYFNDQENDISQNNFYHEQYEQPDDQYVSPFEHMSSEIIRDIINEIEVRPRHHPFLTIDSDISQLPNYLNNIFIEYIERLINYFGNARNYNIDDILCEQIRNGLLVNDNTRRLLIISYNLLCHSNINLNLLMRLDDVVNECIQNVYNNLTFSE